LATEIKQGYFENRAAYYRERVEKGRKLLNLLNGNQSKQEITRDGYDGEIKLEETKDE
jgi:hypothetical protein